MTGPTGAVRLPRRRGAELALLLLAVTLCLAGYCAVDLGARGTPPRHALGYAAGLGAAGLVAHLAVRRRAPYADPVLLPVALLLNGLGLVLIHRLDLDTPGDTAAGSQLVWSALGVALFTLVVTAVPDHRALQRHTTAAMAAALVLMVVPVLFPAVNGARIWVRFGGLSFQPGEFAKVLLAVFFAGRLAAGGAGQQGPRALRPLAGVWLLSVLVLVLERDLGTSLLFFGLFVILLYAATGRPVWVAVGLLAGAAGSLAVGLFEPHVHGRIEDWLHPYASIDAGEGPGQLAQSLFAFGAGGVSGTGLGLGHSVLIGFAVKSDFILATAGEELGLAGLCALFVLYALLVERGLRTALVLPDRFGRLLAVALATVLALQVFVVAGGVTGLIPLTGMALPFLAQGGSSVVTNWVVVALLVRMGDAARRGYDGRRELFRTAGAEADEDAGAAAPRTAAEEAAK